MTDDLPKIYVDVHEDDSDIYSAISARQLGVVQNKNLTTGDVVIRFKGYEVGIEIKRKFDFDNSLHNGRLHDQMYRLTKTYNFPVLIIEGWNGDEMDKHVKKTRTLNRRICLYHTEDQYDTVSLMEDMIRDMKKGKFNVLRRKVVMVDDTDPQVNFLASLPNISVARAVDLLDRYGSPERAFKDIENWEVVKGINESRLEKIQGIWSKEWSSVGE